ncbi:Uncharacterized protein APZ42_015490 [Daphnia magna]|uniref:Uncharacterized protein n=1 Tax=Daphnia magna TaxID=35525 RepID=A0A162PIR8_9CRUS|nr:Uncharacterized protein APZ42_015490 [Daphnia magna]
MDRSRGIKKQNKCDSLVSKLGKISCILFFDEFPTGVFCCCCCCLFFSR